MPNAETFAAYAESWRLWREKSGTLSAGTLAIDRSRVNALLRSPLAEMELSAIKPPDCREAIMWMRDNPPRAARLSNTTMRGLHVYLSMIFSQAVRDGKMARNPMDGMKRPKSDTEEREALSPDEIALFLNRLDEMPLDGRVMALYLMACLGLRRGEACALLDSDIAGGLCHVHQAHSLHAGKVGKPKSKAGVRTLPVPPRLQAKVDEFRASRHCDTEWMCSLPDGSMVEPKHLQGWWEARRAGLGCGGMTLHQLRHSNLSMVARHMSPFDLQRYAGWSSIEPARIYIHDDLDSVSRAVRNAWNALEIESNAPKTHQREMGEIF